MLRGSGELTDEVERLCSLGMAFLTHNKHTRPVQSQ